MSTQQTCPQQSFPVIAVALLSIIAAALIGNLQQRPLGDDPIRMIACGCCIGAFAGWLRWGRPLFLGFAAMAGFPVLALIDLALHGGHNLLPIEFAGYALYGAVGALVAIATRALRARMFPVP